MPQDKRGARRMGTSPGSGWNAIMQYSFLHVFANDRTIDQQELAMLEKLALSDSEVDDEERAVLSRVFSRDQRDHGLAGGLAGGLPVQGAVPDPLSARVNARRSAASSTRGIGRARREPACRRPACAETVARRGAARSDPRAAPRPCPRRHARPPRRRDAGSESAPMSKRSGSAKAAGSRLAAPMPSVR